MESIFRLRIFIFFFLLSIKSTSSQDCSDFSSLSISEQTDIKTLTINKKCSGQKYFILHLNLDIQKNDYDKLTFEVQDNPEGNFSFSISFSLLFISWFKRKASAIQYFYKKNKKIKAFYFFS